MAFARSYLRIFGVMSLVFGVLYLVDPGGILTEAAGFGTLAPGGLTDVRATYGGFQLGLGAFLLWSASDETRVRMSLVLVALSTGAIGLSRSVGLTLDASANPFHVSALITEASLTGFTLYLLKRSSAST